VYLLTIGVVLALFLRLPGGFLPKEDQGYMIVQVQAAAGTTQETTGKVLEEISQYLLGDERAMVDATMIINGSAQGQRGQNVGRMFVRLRPWDERGADGLHVSALSERIAARYRDFQGAQVTPIEPPSIRGLGSATGFTMQLQDRGGLGYEAMDQALKAFMAKAYKTPELAGLFSSYQVNVPQLFADLDRTKARQLGVAVTDVFDTMQIYLGSLYVNDFNKFGRTYSVRVQADAAYRARAEDIGALKVRSSSGEMVPLSALMKVSPSFGPERALRYNGFLSADINGGAAPGFSSGQAQAAVERIAAETLPPGIGYEWTDLTYQEKIAGNSAIWVFPLAILLVFLVLAAQYESLTLPIAILLIVPMGLLAAMTGVWLSHGDNNVFTQIGLIVLVGLSAKNAILIVEFARELEFAGRTPMQAALEAARLRLRPILMTSMAFVMGVLPLVLSSGAGAEMRQAMGVAVFAGMIGVTLFGLFLTPLFYVIVRRLAGNAPLRHHGGQVAAPVAPTQHVAPVIDALPQRGK